MEILNIGPWELVIFLIIAFLLLGPKGMILTAYKMGQWIRSAVRSPMWREILHYAQEIRELPKKLMDETGLEAELKNVKDTTDDVMKEVGQSIKEVTEAARVPEAEHLRLETGQNSVPSNSTPSGVKQFIPLATFPGLTETGEVKKLTPEELKAAAAPNVEATPEEMAAPDLLSAAELGAEVSAAQEVSVPSETSVVLEEASVQEVPAAEVSDTQGEITTPVQEGPAVNTQPSEKTITAADKYAARRTAVQKRIERVEAQNGPEPVIEFGEVNQPDAEKPEVTAAKEMPAAKQMPAAAEVLPTAEVLPAEAELPIVPEVQPRKRASRKKTTVQAVETTTETVEPQEIAPQEAPAPKRSTRKKAVVQMVETTVEPVVVDTPLTDAPASLEMPARKRTVRKPRAIAAENVGENSNGSKPATIDVAVTAVEEQVVVEQKPARRPRKPRVTEE